MNNKLNSAKVEKLKKWLKEQKDSWVCQAIETPISRTYGIVLDKIEELEKELIFTNPDDYLIDVQHFNAAKFTNNRPIKFRYKEVMKWIDSLVLRTEKDILTIGYANGNSIPRMDIRVEDVNKGEILLNCGFEDMLVPSKQFNTEVLKVGTPVYVSYDPEKYSGFTDRHTLVMKIERYTAAFAFPENKDGFRWYTPTVEDILSGNVRLVVGK